MCRVVYIMRYILLVILAFSPCSILAQGNDSILQSKKSKISNSNLLYVRYDEYDDVFFEGHRLKKVLSIKDKDSVIQYLGEPENIQLEEDKTNSGLVIMQRWVAEYPGYKAVFEEKGDGFELGAIIVTSSKVDFRISNTSIGIGDSLSQLMGKDFDPKSSRSSLSIFIEDAERQFRPERIKVWYKDDRIDKIRIMPYTI